MKKKTIVTCTVMGALGLLMGPFIYYKLHAEKLTDKACIREYIPAVLHEQAAPSDIPEHPMTIEEYNNRSHYGPLRSYLADVDIDGSLRMTPEGHLVRSRDIRRFFDFFLMAVNDEGLDICSGRIEEVIGMVLKGEARKEALDIWRSYKTYRQSLSDGSEMTDSGSRKEGIERFENILAERIALRRKTMGQEIAALFFGDEEAADRYLIEKTKIQNNSSMSAAEKAEALRSLSEKRPHIWAAKEAMTREDNEFDEKIERMRQSGDRNGMFALREERYGKESADRLAALDSQKDSLNRRILEFNRSVKLIEKETDLSSQEKTKKILDLKTSTFTEWERPLVKT